VNLVDVGIIQGTTFVSLTQTPGATVSPAPNWNAIDFAVRLASSVSSDVTLYFEWAFQGVTTTLAFPLLVEGNVPTDAWASLPIGSECCYSGPSGTLRLTLSGITTAYTYHVLTPAPEPGTALLVLSALLGAAGWVRRRA
jgi:hypothetical protein